MPRTTINENDIFSPNAVQTEEKAKTDTSTIVYTLRGQQVFDKDQLEAYAYKQNGECFIKLNRRQEILNPLDIGHVNSITAVENGMARWRWYKIPQAAFESYLQFLKTHNASFLNVARRQIVSEVL